MKEKVNTIKNVVYLYENGTITYDEMKGLILEELKEKHYLVQDSARGKVFETLEEANAYASDHQKKTGDFVNVCETARKVTHYYKI